MVTVGGDVFFFFNDIARESVGRVVVIRIVN